ncbi:Glucan biosynthesis protein D [Pseudomonas meliae]|uniref:Glucan biosynthesis protein D n=2 Tax=Pseudomonas meliae TaxID=86176 RepID=A0A0P9YKN7_9PSED|nr:Glucan biosynthesis protein D [Pseudomonas meliae]
MNGWLWRADLCSGLPPTRSTPTMLNRRNFLEFSSISALLFVSGIPSSSQADEPQKMGDSEPFSFDLLVQRAKEAASQPYIVPLTLPAEVLAKLDYDAHGKIRFKPEYALFAEGPGRFPVTFFHPGKFFPKPVRLYVVDKGAAREILYDQAYFDMPEDSPARQLTQGVGFAGFRFQESRTGDQKKLDWRNNDWTAFLGAAYFRAIGELYQYGLSARGIALDVAQPERAEEFPDFTHFWFESPDSNTSDSVVVYALLYGPSICGAYRFAIQRGKGVVMEVEAALFMRGEVQRFGIAPISSMYWFSEQAKKTAADWRPEVHDSDGLAIWTGAGERIWRPLNNPPRTMASAFSDNNPRGFGLLQRDREFSHYLDGVHYERRPSLWIEPLGDWGKGAVQLVEIPTDDEIHDNIVAMWVPEKPAGPGTDYRLRYRLHWLADEPYPGELAHCVATRFGNGGRPGQTRPQGVRKFVVEFQGRTLENVPFNTFPEAVLSSSRGTFSNIFTEAVPDGMAGHWRAQFDLTVEGAEPVDMRLYLRLGEQTLTESWLYQYHPS